MVRNKYFFMFKNKPSIYFNLGIYASLDTILLSLLILAFLHGYTLGVPANSFVNVVQICLGLLSLFTIPALLVLAVAHETIPKKLKDSFYGLCINNHKYVFTCGVTIPIVMFVISFAIYAVFLAMADFMPCSVLVVVEIFASLCVSPLLVKLFVILKD